MTLKIIFVCMANQFRSPIAAAVFSREIQRHKLDGDIQVSSAGTWTVQGQSATPEAVQFGEEHQIDLTLHRSRPISEKLLSQYDLVLTMTTGQMESLQIEFPKHRDKIKLFSEAADFPPFDIPDPYVDNHKPEDVAEEIVKIINGRFDKVIELLWSMEKSLE
ncbi:low molecular weight protein arginine phosphatase [bacterium]|nr:low molecular weight protein arginine phosphatase [bacterium]